MGAWAKALALSLALAGTFAVVSLFESAISSCEQTHPELRAMVSSRLEFMLALREVRRISARTLGMEPRPMPVKLWDMPAEERDENGSYLIPVSGGVLRPPPNAVWYHFADVTDFVTCPRLVREAFGGAPRDCPIRTREDIKEAHRICPILRLIDREIFPFSRHFEAGAKLELRRYKHPYLQDEEEAFVLHIMGAPRPVSEGIHHTLNMVREANGLPRQPSADEREWDLEMAVPAPR